MGNLFSPQELSSLTTLIKHIRLNGWSYLEPAALLELAVCGKLVEQKDIKGIFVEAGCALGGSAIVLTAVKKDRPLFIYDVFGLIPAPSLRDGPDVHKRYETIKSGKSKGISGNKYYGYYSDLLDKVKSNFQESGYPSHLNNVSFIQGLYNDTLFPSEPISLAHIDCDWYESVSCCLERIAPFLSQGGRMIIDDYFSWSGAHTAVDEFMAKYSGEFITEVHSRLHIIRAQ